MRVEDLMVGDFVVSTQWGGIGRVKSLDPLMTQWPGIKRGVTANGVLYLVRPDYAKQINDYFTKTSMNWSLKYSEGVWIDEAKYLKEVAGKVREK